MREQKTPVAALPSAIRWAAVAFLCACLIGGLGIDLCARHHCLIYLPKWVGSIGSGYIWLSAPWLLVLNWGSNTPWQASLTAVVVGAAGTIAILVFTARHWSIRLRNFLAAPLPSWEGHPNSADDIPPPSPSPLSMVVALVVVLAFGFISAASKYGLSFETAQRFGSVFAIVALLTAIPFYFEVRRSQRPNKLEIALAFAWTALRRLLLGTVALLFALFALASLRSGALLFGSLALLFAAVLAWWGWFGAGYSRAFSDDLPAHEARKRRYGWK